MSPGEKDRSARRVAAVSGGSSGIGRAVAEALAAEGYAVAVGARGEERLRETVSALRAGGAAAQGARLDVADPASVEAFFAEVEAALGPVTAAVSCAAHARPARHHERCPQEIRAEIETGLLGALLFARRAAAGMLERGLRGDLVFLSSAAAAAPWPFLTAYAATKAGLEQAARSLALELEGRGLRCLVVRVGNTAGTDWAARWGPEELAFVEAWRRFGLLRHPGLLDPPRVARAVLAALRAPRGAQLDLVCVNPEGGAPEAGD